MTSPYGTLDQHAQPAAVIEAEADRRSTHIYWENKKGQAPAVDTHYVSDFRVVSVDRRYDPLSCRVSWSDILRYNAENKVTFAEANADIANLAAKLKYSKSPVETVIEYCKWIRDNLTYDSNCNFAGDDVQTILTYRRGHCLHFMNLFKALCNSAGISCRSVKGLNLHTSASEQDLTRHDVQNIHIWTEVMLPGVGWVEVEPIGGEKCFVIPAAYVQNNTHFQNFAVWIQEAGSLSREPKWILKGKTYVNEYSVQHDITFTETKR
jgi:transglutaminase-like putative cysteine protease